MAQASSLRALLHNLLQDSHLTFRDFVELALYHPEFGYYTRPVSPIGKDGDYVTSPLLSPVFAFALGRLRKEFVNRASDEAPSIVDVGCGDGALIRALAREEGADAALYFGVDRFLGRVSSADLGEGERSQPAEPNEGSADRVTFLESLDRVPRDGAQLIISNELFDALPFARLVRRGEDELHELWVAERDGILDWSEHEAEAAYADYFAARGIELAEGQFADVSLEWGAMYEEICAHLTRGLVVTFDYGFPQKQLFDPRIRRFGTAAAYRGQRVTRDLLANPGEQDLTAHINFDDLIRAGERKGLRTLFFGRQAKFLLSLGITGHELFRPSTELTAESAEEALALLDRRDEARRLILPDGIGEDIRVLVQEKGMGVGEWLFERAVF
jgi:SAM-dependent MidA family methyltransferase